MKKKIKLLHVITSTNPKTGGPVEGLRSMYKFSNKFNIHRTRQNFPYDGIDNFDNMAENGVKVIEKLMLKEMEAKLNKEKTCWIIPFKSNN
mgnify:CR=1 FL=1